jgi:hypothetical protein
MSATKLTKDSEITAEIKLPEGFQKKTEVIKVDFQEKKISPEDKTKDNLKIDTKSLMLELDLEEKKEVTIQNKEESLPQKNHSSRNEIKTNQKIETPLQKNNTSTEKELLEALKKVHHLKNELQFFFESHLDEKRKQTLSIEKQLENTQKIHESLSEINFKIKKDLFDISDQIKVLNLDKIELIKEISALKIEISENKQIALEYNFKKNDLKVLEDKIFVTLEKAKEVVLQEEKLKHLVQEIKIHEIQLGELKHQVELKTHEKNELHHKIDELGLTKSLIQSEVEKRKDDLIFVEREILETKKRLDSYRSEEFQLSRSLQEKNRLLVESTNSLARIESQITNMHLLYDETHELYKERKEHLEREIEQFKINLQVITENEENQKELKIHKWEKEYSDFTIAKQEELKNQLEKMKDDQITKIQFFKKDLASKLAIKVEEKLNNYNFITKEEKLKIISKEIEVFINNNLEELKKKFW